MKLSTNKRTRRLPVDTITLILLAVLLIANLRIMIMSLESDKKLTYQFDKVISDIHSYKLYLPENKNKFNTQGVYFSSGYYCVNTEGRDWTDIKMTDYHEMCHAFVDMDYGHFCNKSNQTNFDISNYIGR